MAKRSKIIRRTDTPEAREFWRRVEESAEHFERTAPDWLKREALAYDLPYYPEDRAAEKAASRKADEDALASGEKTREQLRRENSALGWAADGKINFKKSKSLK